MLRLEARPQPSGFWSYGSPMLALLLTVVIWSLQVLISVWWLRRFRFGPVEWFWRVVTYWSGQPMRKEQGKVVAATT